MENQIKLLLEKLEAIYHIAVKNPTPKFFFLSLLEYIELYDTDSILEPIWRRIIALGEPENENTNFMRHAKWLERWDSNPRPSG